MIRTHMPTKIYKSQGKCILCLQPFPEDQLTDEHVIPKFLSSDGEMYMRKSSCSACNAYCNKQFEQPAANADFLVPRLLLDLKRRKKKSKKALPLCSLDPKFDINTAEPDDYNTLLEADTYPDLLSFYGFEPAGRICETERSGDLGSVRFCYIHLDRGKKLPAPSVATSILRNHTAFSLTLAKIAYCFAVGELGIHGFDGAEVRSLLKGDRSDVYNFVGGTLTAEFLTKRHLHKLYFRERGEWLTVIVHLFASCEAPPYEVVVGKHLQQKALLPQFGFEAGK